MATDRLQLAKDRLNAYYQAELAVLSGQEYQMGSRRLRRADLPEIRRAISELEALVRQLEAHQSGDTSYKTRRIVLRDL